MKELKIALLMPLLDLQYFAAGNNNDQPADRFERNFRDLLPTVFNKKSYFGDFSAGGLEALDGVTESATAFTIKTTDIPVTIGTYSTDANNTFGTGAAGSNRFGNLVEIINVNVDVPYTANWSFREGFDRFTVNNDLNRSVARRLQLQAEAQTKLIDQAIAAKLVADAAVSLTLAGYTDAGVKTLFDTLAKTYTNLEVDKDSVVVKCNPDLYNAIVNGALATTGKNSGVNIDSNSIARYKGFAIIEVPDSKLPSGQAAIVYPVNVGKAFTGISTARTIEATNFDGKELQGAGKYGTYILPDNKKAVVKVAVPTP